MRVYFNFLDKRKRRQSEPGTQHLLEARRDGCGAAGESICVKPSVLMGASSLRRAALFDCRSETEQGDCWPCKRDHLHANAEGRAASCVHVCVCVRARVCSRA